MRSEANLFTEICKSQCIAFRCILNRHLSQNNHCWWMYHFIVYAQQIQMLVAPMHKAPHSFHAQTRAPRQRFITNAWNLNPTNFTCIQQYNANDLSADALHYMVHVFIHVHQTLQMANHTNPHPSTTTPKPSVINFSIYNNKSKTQAVPQ